MSVPAKSLCVPLPFALGPNGDLVHAANEGLSRGRACGCTCLGCKERLLLKRGPIKAPHFAHKAGSSCSGGVGYWHRIAQLMLENSPGLPLKSSNIEVYCESKVLGNNWQLSGSIELPSCLAFRSVTSEDRSILPGYIVDVLAFTNSTTAGRLIIEIKDTHAIDNHKWMAIKRCGIPAVEIDISEIRRNQSLTSSMLSFATFLITAPRTWIVSIPEYEAQRQALKDELRRQVVEMEKAHLDHERSLRLEVGPSLVRARALRGMASVHQVSSQPTRNMVEA